MRNLIFNTENWREIIATLSRNKTRTFLTAFGIFWGTAMLAMLWGGASGLEGLMRRNFSGLSTNMGGVVANRTSLPYKGYNKGRTWNLTDHDFNTIRSRVPQIQYMAAATSEWGATLTYERSTTQGAISGVSPDYFNIQVPVVYSGRILNESDEVQGRKVAVLGKNLADALFGAEDPVGKYVSANGIYFQIVGVAGQTSQGSINARVDESITIPSSTFRRAYNRGDKIDFVVYTARDGYTPTDLKPTIIKAICSNHPIDPDDPGAFWFIDISEMFRTVDTLFLGISLLALFVGLGSLLSGIIGVGNIMMIIVRERTLEIGVRRALGARPVDIISQILSESMLLTLVAGLLGVCFATGVLGVADVMTHDPMRGDAGFHLTLTAATVIVIVFSVLGTAAGILPAMRAMRIKPVEAMRDK